MKATKELIEQLNNGVIPRELIKYIKDYKVGKYNDLDDYYYARLNILRKERIDPTAPNNKIIANYARYITVLNVGYFMSTELKYTVNDENIDISAIMDKYIDNTMIEVDQSNAIKLSKYGKAYELIYVNEKAEIKSKSISPKNAFVLKSDDIEETEEVGVYIADEENIYIYTKENQIYLKGLKEGATAEVTPHQFNGMLPLIEYLNNEDAIGDYENVITLIDAYNKVVSNDIDNIEDFIDSILVLYGSDISSEQAKLLRETRGLKMNKDERAEYLIKVLDEVGITAVLKRLRQDIHKFSFTPDMSDENFIGNSSGVALAYKILPFEMLAKTKEAFYEKSAKRRFQLYNLFLSKSENLPIIPLNALDIVFTRGLPKNDLEISQMIGNLQGKVTNKSLISLLSFINDANEEDEKIKEEREENIKMQQEMFKGAGEFVKDEK